MKTFVQGFNCPKFAAGVENFDKYTERAKKSNSVKCFFSSNFKDIATSQVQSKWSEV